MVMAQVQIIIFNFIEYKLYKIYCKFSLIITILIYLLKVVIQYMENHLKMNFINVLNLLEGV